MSGNIHRDAALTVNELMLGDDPACGAIRQRMDDDDYVLLLGRDISISRGFTGTLAITIPVGTQYNGQIVTILHCVGGTLNAYTATKKGGKATFDVTSLSPFAIFIEDGLDDIPKTGDVGAAFIWWLLLGMSGAGITTLVLVRKKAFRKRS